MPLSFENITGELIKTISSKVWDKESNGYEWIQEVLIETTKANLLLVVNPDLDEIDVEVGEGLQHLPMRGSDVSIHKIEEESPLAVLLNKKIDWVWTLINNQGYHDGFQIQARSEEVVLIQFIAICSQIKILSLQRS